MFGSMCKFCGCRVSALPAWRRTGGSQCENKEYASDWVAATVKRRAPGGVGEEAEVLDPLEEARREAFAAACVPGDNVAVASSAAAGKPYRLLQVTKSVFIVDKAFKDNVTKRAFGVGDRVVSAFHTSKAVRQPLRNRIFYMSQPKAREVTYPSNMVVKSGFNIVAERAELRVIREQKENDTKLYFDLPLEDEASTLEALTNVDDVDEGLEDEAEEQPSAEGDDMDL
jgi:hypothetical protein